MRSKFGHVAKTASGWYYAEYQLNNATCRESFSTREEAEAWLQSEQATADARREHRTPRMRLTPPEQGGTAYSNLFTTGVKVSTAAVGNPGDIIVILPPELFAERQRIDAVIGEYISPTWHHVRVVEHTRLVSAICGHGILPHEQRTLWDVLTAAADRRGFHLCTNGKLTKATDEIDAQAHNLRIWTTAFEEAS